MGQAFARSILRVFTATSRKSAGSLNYVIRHYPRVYKLIMDAVSRGECPLCGRQLQRRFALAPHIRGRNCSEDWMELARSMYGKNRKSEEEVLDLINSIRERHGAPPFEVWE